MSQGYKLGIRLVKFMGWWFLGIFVVGVLWGMMRWASNDMELGWVFMLSLLMPVFGLMYLWQWVASPWVWVPTLLVCLAGLYGLGLVFKYRPS